MKRLLAIFIMAGLVGATAVAQRSPAPQTQHVSHGDSASVDSAVQSDSASTTSSSGAASSKKSSSHKKMHSKKPKKQQSQPMNGTQPQ
jgi:hypothetical protein